VRAGLALRRVYLLTAYITQLRIGAALPHRPIEIIVKLTIHICGIFFVFDGLPFANQPPRGISGVLTLLGYAVDLPLEPVIIVDAARVE